MSTATEPTYIDGWEEREFDGSYRIVGRQDLAWFIQGPLNSVIAHPPVHLTRQEAMDWFRIQERDGLSQPHDARRKS